MSVKLDNLTWKTRWVMRRNAILGSARFQRWASRTPIVRGIARTRAAAQFDLVAGFVYSQILSAFVTVGLIEFLGGHLRSFDGIVTQTGLEAGAAQRLMKAAQALQLAESPQPGLWTLGEAGAPLSANEGAMAMIRHHHLLYHDLADPLALLAKDRREETALSVYWNYASKGDEGSAVQDADYSALMAATQPMVTQQVIDAYDFARHAAMLDIGGGSGAFAMAIAAAAPRLGLGIFDLPDVIAKAEQRFSGTVDVKLHPGSFKQCPLPDGYDLITMVRILHDHDDDVAQALLSKIHGALPKGGRLLIIEPLAGSPHAARMGDAYFGFYLWAMGSGRPRPFGEVEDMLYRAGFSGVKPLKTALPIITSAIVATK